MSTLINDVLNYSTLLKNTPRFAELDLNEVPEETLEAFTSEIAMKKAKITVGPLPVVLGVDSRLLLLFNNIVGNALTFSEASPALEIHSTEIAGKSISNLGADPKQRYVKIAFKDNRIRFDDAYNVKIFEIFERLHTRGSHTGNGMGLPLCKKIVEKSQGFDHRDESGGGTVRSLKYIFLPPNRFPLDCLTRRAINQESFFYGRPEKRSCFKPYQETSYS